MAKHVNAGSTQFVESSIVFNPGPGEYDLDQATDTIARKAAKKPTEGAKKHGEPLVTGKGSAPSIPDPHKQRQEILEEKAFLED